MGLRWKWSVCRSARDGTTRVCWNALVLRRKSADRDVKALSRGRRTPGGSFFPSTLHVLDGHLLLPPSPPIKSSVRSGTWTVTLQRRKRNPFLTPELHRWLLMLEDELRTAAAVGVLDDVLTLLHKGADFAADSSGRTPLHLAAAAGSSEIVAKLATSTNVNLPDVVGRTALQIAATGGHVEVVQVLLKCGANPNIKDNLVIPIVSAHCSSRNLRLHGERFRNFYKSKFFFIGFGRR
ncbi:hypothetical protein GE061_010514 [Apolygus lucorum]|uniref:Uncharacterized protein n=1 Tax=Apolygus lucorum TaxID=248454 RepID=A0A8S9XYV5_APOLU|nr:hypothetical protein GE061_010514 [Apolygus lucorum]